MSDAAGWLHSANLRIDRLIQDLAKMAQERDAARALLIASNTQTKRAEQERDAARAALREMLTFFGRIDTPVMPHVLDRWRRARESK